MDLFSIVTFLSVVTIKYRNLIIWHDKNLVSLIVINFLANYLIYYNCRINILPLK